MQTVVHPIAPLFSSHAHTLILGSFPSVKSREGMFFYHHPQNRFWHVLSSLFNENLPHTVDEKRALILHHNLALWDVIGSCTIDGSDDASIRDVVVNDLTPIFSAAPVTRIFCNGKTAHKLYCKHQLPHTGIEAICLPSTSPANAQWSLDRLCQAWQVIVQPPEPKGAAT